MKKLLQTTLLLLSLLGGYLGAAAQGTNNMNMFVPSNFGGWQNLSFGPTDTTSFSSNHLPNHWFISGNTIHVAWSAWAKDADGKYNIYYRRSTDLGRTWEATRTLVSSEFIDQININYQDGNFGCNTKWMAVEGQNVYIVTCLTQDSNNGQLLYTYSRDGGRTFQQRVLAEDYTYGRPHVQCDGQTVVIAVTCAGSGWQRRPPHVFTSFDGGTTFNEKEIDKPQNVSYLNLEDLQVSGRRWALLTWYDNWYNGMIWGNVYLSTSTDGGETVTTQNIAPIVKDNTSWSHIKVQQNGSFNYHPQMTLDGNVINVIFKGCAFEVEGTLPKNDINHTIFRRSTDGGQTWTDAIYLPESNGSVGTIAAKGQNIYVLQHPSYKLMMYHSHDGGKTWAIQDRCYWPTNYGTGIGNFFDLYIAPDDATGQHVYVTSTRGSLVESRDGLRTVYRNFAIGTESWDNKRSYNHSLSVLLDQQGTEHWLMNYSAPYSGTNYNTDYFWNIVHRRNDPLPATGNTNKALDISRIPDQPVELPITNVIIPMTPSIMETKDATTVECWVRVDEGVSFQIASLTNDAANYSGSEYYGGWYINIDCGNSHDWFSVKAGVSTELSVDGKGKAIWDGRRLQVKEWGQWHHVALTYDSHVSEDNIRLYMDGLLMGVATEQGALRIGNNPISIGRSNNSSWYAPSALVDNFAIYSRALTQEEIRGHIYNMPDASDSDCRLLLTFDGSLQDKSQYHNDAAPLLDALFTEHDGIRPPHPEFTLSQDLSGQNVYLNDMTQDGEAYWWVLPDPWNLDRIDKYSTKQTPHVTQNVSGHPGTYRYDMVARGTGDCNAYASAPSKSIIIGGLKRVYPESAAQAPGVELRIEGGYCLTYSSKPRVALHGPGGDFEGEWLVERGYDSNNIFSPEDLAPAEFDLRNVAAGKYDIIVGNDTLFQAFTVEPSEYPDVWVEVTGCEKMLWGKYQKFTINYGNRSNTPAFNVPFILCVPDKKGYIDVQFEFDINPEMPDFDEEELATFYQLNEYTLVPDDNGDSVRVYALLIPYIGPNCTEQRSFRVRYNRPNDADLAILGNEFEMYYTIEDPWGTDYWDPEQGRVVWPWEWTQEQAICIFEKMYWRSVASAADLIPFVGCAHRSLRTYIQGYFDFKEGKSNRWINLINNCVVANMLCASDILPFVGQFKAAVAAAKIGAGLYKFLIGYWEKEECLERYPKKKGQRAVFSYDPNEMIGPWGPDEQAHYIQPIRTMPYTITFENKSTATAPANEVVITDTLDLTKLDASTFCFTDFGWDNQDFTVGGQNTQNFTQNLPYTVNGVEIQVRVSGQFDPETGVVHWNFVSLQKNGNELEDIMLGFLAPNNDDHVGEGYVSFTINHKPDPEGGSTVSNEATIIFDANEAIKTNTFTNTFDTDYPTSEVVNITERNGGLDVTIAGSDGTSGIDHYDLIVFLNGTDDYIVVNNQKQNVIHVPYQAGVMKYGFCVMGTDRVGWHDRKNLTPEVNYNTGLWGDVNLDLEVNIADVNAVIDVILSGGSGVVYDVNYDGEINIADINTILDIILQ